jgi:adenylate cyclase
VHRIGALGRNTSLRRRRPANGCVTAQLIEARAGTTVGKRYDRELGDIFASGRGDTCDLRCHSNQLDRLAVEHLRRKPPNNLTAYDCELRGRWAFFHLAEGLAVALNWYEKAVEADPTYALAHAGLGMTSVFGILSLGLTPEPTLVRGREHARKAVMLDEANPTVNCYAAFTYHISGDHQLTRKHAERAVSLNPNDPFAIYVLGCALSYTGEPERALECFAGSERLEPYAPDDQRLDVLCDCYYMLRNYAKVIEIHEAYQNVPAFLYLVLAAAYAQDGQLEKAAAAVKSYEQLRPPGTT